MGKTKTLVLLITALILILFFYIGVGSPESLNIANTSKTLADHIRELISTGFASEAQVHFLELRGELGLLNIISALPLSLVYLVGGVSDFTRLVFPVSST